MIKYYTDVAYSIPGLTTKLNLIANISKIKDPIVSVCNIGSVNSFAIVWKDEK